jgi:hypothetical protein
MWAIDSRSITIFQALLNDARTDVDYETQSGQTAFCYAINLLKKTPDKRIMSMMLDFYLMRMIKHPKLCREAFQRRPKLCSQLSGFQAPLWMKLQKYGSEKLKRSEYIQLLQQIHTSWECVDKSARHPLYTLFSINHTPISKKRAPTNFLLEISNALYKAKALGGRTSIDLNFFKRSLHSRYADVYAEFRRENRALDALDLAHRP